jgi:hypothetical protein
VRRKRPSYASSLALVLIADHRVADKPLRADVPKGGVPSFHSLVSLVPLSNRFTSLQVPQADERPHHESRNAIG